MSQRILLADDEPDILGMLCGHLRDGGFDVVETLNGQDALHAARELSPAFAVLDSAMPGMSGLEVCREMKSDSRTKSIPLMMLTGRESETDRIVAFELGVDDYVTKPFSPREVVLRIRAILRRQAPAPEPLATLQVGAIVIDEGSHRVTVGGTPIELTVIEFKLLVALARRCEQVFSREKLLTTIWGETYEVEARTIDTHFRRLRDKLGCAAPQISTVRGFGYRLTAG